MMPRIGLLMMALVCCLACPLAAAPPAPVFNRAPLAEKPYAELPLGEIRAQGWLLDELRRMAAGMSGHLDEWYPEVCGDRNAWLGGDGDCWERGPYWIDGLVPLARILGDEPLQAKAQRWIEWTLTHQRDDGQIGPKGLKKADRKRPPPPGAQIIKPDDWWPRMVMLKILQQHYMATGDARVIECLTRYFRFQLAELPKRPLHDPANPASGSWWAAQRGGDNLMVVLWLYNVTGERWLLDLAELLHRQTVPVTDWFLAGDHIPHRADQGESLHCVNLAQMMKTPLVRYQQDRDARHLEAVRKAFADIRTFQGQAHGLYGGDEPLHGDCPNRGSELCSAVEMMFSLETMLEISGDADFADRLERVAFNALPTQCTDDFRARQYFQQANQVEVTLGDRDFFNDQGDRLVYGLLQGYPCCTCNLHQGWPKFIQHLWFASKDGGLAALVYGPSRVTAQVRGGPSVTLVESGGYPFHEGVTIDVQTAQAVSFPLHLRIPGWCEGAAVSVNGEKVDRPARPGTIVVLDREWKQGDRVELRLPMPLRSTRWYERTVAVERGPLVFALRVEEDWREVPGERPEGVPADAMHRGCLECRPKSPWNYALSKEAATRPGEYFRAEVSATIPDNPWTLDTAPVVLYGTGVRLPDWVPSRRSAAPPPLSPVQIPAEHESEPIRLIPYGSTTLRISEFPWFTTGPRR